MSNICKCECKLAITRINNVNTNLKDEVDMCFNDIPFGGCNDYCNSSLFNTECSEQSIKNKFDLDSEINIQGISIQKSSMEGNNLDCSGDIFSSVQSDIDTIVDEKYTDIVNNLVEGKYTSCEFNNVPYVCMNIEDSEGNVDPTFNTNENCRKVAESKQITPPNCSSGQCSLVTLTNQEGESLNCPKLFDSTSPPSPPSSSGGLSTGVIIGIVIGIVVFLSSSIAGIYYLWNYTNMLDSLKSKNGTKPKPSASAPPPLSA